MFIQYAQRFWRPIQDLSDKYNILQAAMAACERIFKLLDTPPEILNPAEPQEGDGSNRIEFDHVWFTYQKLTDVQKAAVAAASGRPPALLLQTVTARIRARLQSCAGSAKRSWGFSPCSRCGRPCRDFAAWNGS